MGERILKIALIIIVILLVIIMPMYITDISRMKQNKPVVFSTWGVNYAPSVENTTSEDENLGKYLNNMSTNNTTGSTTIPQEISKINTVLTLDDEIQNDTIWCGTFQLIWNDLKNQLVKQNIQFIGGQPKVVDNLNKETFTTRDLTDKYYYKRIGIPSPVLKQEIEQAIKQKFNETSDILDDYNFESYKGEDYFLYAMLKKEFQFENPFQILDNGTFGKYKDVKYFGADDDETSKLRQQITVLYYNTKNDFAIKLKTKQEDEVILCKNPEGKTFNEIYKNIIKKQNQHYGARYINSSELVKIPNIVLDEKNEFKEIENQSFFFSNGKSYHIEKAMQTIKFELDNKGGKIKSEAGMMAVKDSAIIADEVREFALDDTFAIFLIENGKNTPYFAGKIDDITKFQK